MINSNNPIITAKVMNHKFNYIDFQNIKNIEPRQKVQLSEWKYEPGTWVLLKEETWYL